MNHHRVTWSLIGMSLFIICGPWPGQAAAQVNIDVGGIHIQVGDRPPPALPAQLPNPIQIIGDGHEK